MKNFSKRAFDVVTAATLLVLTAPIAGFLMVLMAIDTHSNPIFKTKRMGRNEETFTMYKIKTLSDDVGAELLRVSKLGKFIRRSRLDELPQLINILKGDMSMVGPRPHPIIKGAMDNAKRYSVRPGLTGAAKIAGFNSLTLDQELDIDLRYIREMNSHSLFYNMASDIKIIAQTPWAIFKYRKSPHIRPASNLNPK